LTWLREKTTERPIPGFYELIHGDFHRNNFKMTPDGQIAMIDLGAMTYGYFESDLVDARWGFIDQPWWEGFCADYFAVNPEGRERFERYAPLFFGLFYLNKASVRAVRARKSLEKDRPEAAEIHRAKGQRYWNLLLAAMDGEPLRRDLLFEFEDD
ncbi:phosphotransferase, partial [Candidatus Sumerlaeota bacterium]|nr:phosphotransferase [Candidatus Sumerlaeota bacterium]